MKKQLGYFIVSLSVGLCVQHASASRLEDNHCALDVVSSVKSMAAIQRTNLALWTNDQMEGQYYTQKPKAVFGFQDHLQGITRLRDTRFVVITGANYWKKKPQIFVGELPSRSTYGAFGTNLYGVPQNQIPLSDKLIGHIDIPDSKNWHAGAVSSIGDIVVVPISNSKIPWDFKTHSPSSRILFYDFSDPFQPRKLSVEIARPSKNTGSVSIEKMPDGRFVVLTTSDNIFDFYYSKTTNLEDGFDSDRFVTGQWPMKANFRAQGVSLVRQCDGRIFALTFDNDGKIALVLKGSDVIYVHEVAGAFGTPYDKIFLVPRTVGKVMCGSLCSFDAGSGIYIGSDHKARVYSTGFYRHKSGAYLPFAEFDEERATFAVPSLSMPSVVKALTVPN